MFKLLLFAWSFAFLILLNLPQARASSIDDSAYSAENETMGYDAIVEQLNRENSARAATLKSKMPAAAPAENSFDTVMIHSGIGFANAIQTLTLDDGTSSDLKLSGFQLALGIDLFSPNWMAEGTLRNLNTEGDNRLAAAIREFELKVLYKDRFTQRLGFHAGAGITGRYLKTTRLGVEQDYTTPSSVATLGGDVFISDRFSFGADVNARNSLIGETIDRGSFDLTLRLDAHF